MGADGADQLPNLPLRLKELRLSMGWSLEDLAEKVGVAQRGVVSNWEATNQRRRTPPLSTLLTLQRWYGVSMDYLLGHPLAEVDSPAVKAGKKALLGELRKVTGVQRMTPNERAVAALSLALDLASEAFFPERVAACLMTTPDHLKLMLEGGVWSDAALQNLANVLGFGSEWFYAPEPAKVLEAIV